MGLLMGPAEPPMRPTKPIDAPPSPPPLAGSMSGLHSSPDLSPCGRRSPDLSAVVLSQRIRPPTAVRREDEASGDAVFICSEAKPRHLEPSTTPRRRAQAASEPRGCAQVPTTVPSPPCTERGEVEKRERRVRKRESSAESLIGESEWFWGLGFRLGYIL